MDPISTLARHVVDVSFDRLPPETINGTKMSFLDSTGTLIVGSTAPGCKEIADQVFEWGGKPESTVLMRGGKVPTHNAALVNSAMARAIDFDDAMHKGMHLSASLVPTAIAVAERRGGVSGKELLTAIALGADIAGRIDSATVDYHGFDATVCCGVFGSTTVAAKLLGLDEAQIANAFGIALNRASGTFQSHVDGALSVRLNQGFAASAGVTSTLFAQRGITGVKNVLDGQWGYFHLFSRDEREAEHLTQDLGVEFYGNRTVFKRWPSCGATLSATDAILDLVEEHSIRPEQIETVTVRFGQFLHGLVGHPFKIGENPVVDAQFNVRYAVANAIVRGRPTLEHFTEKYIRNPQVLDLVGRVETIRDDTPKYNQPPYHNGAEVTVVLRDGRTLSRYVKSWKGHFTDPLTMEDIAAKFFQNLEYASEWFDGGNGPQIADFVTNLEKVEDVTRLVDLLQFKRKVK